jgi:hypothetical protein
MLYPPKFHNLKLLASQITSELEQERPEDNIVRMFAHPPIRHHHHTF